MKSSEILTAVKPLLWDGKQPNREIEKRFICYAVKTVCYDNPLLYEKQQIILEHITTLLEGHYVFEQWLRSRGIKKPDNNPKLMKTRQRWVNDMIKYFKSKGD
jgi:hypothetical protein